MIHAVSTRIARIFEDRVVGNPFVLVLVGVAGVIVARACGVYEPAALAVGITAIGWAPIMWLLCLAVRERFFRSLLTFASLLSVVFMLLPLAYAAPDSRDLNWGYPWLFFMSGFAFMWMALLWLAIRGGGPLRLCFGALGVMIGLAAPRTIMLILLNGLDDPAEDHAIFSFAVLCLLTMYLVSLTVVAVGRVAILRLFFPRKEQSTPRAAQTTEDRQADEQRRRYQFSLRSILVVVAIVALACSWLATKRSQFTAQRETIKAIMEPGSRVDYSGYVELGRSKYSYPRSIYWSTELLSIEAYDSACVTLSGKDVNDGDLERLTRLAPASVVQLDIVEASITDDGLRHLAQLQALESLQIMDTPITDDGLKRLGKLRRLRRLYLINSEVRGSTLGSLRDCPLGILGLSGSPVGDDALANLSHLNGLQDLILKGTEITDAGLRHLAAMGNLSFLEIAGTNVTDEGLRELGRMHNLSLLNLSSTRITDSGLRHLESLRGLTNLSLANTRVTGAGLAHLAALHRLRKLNLEETDIDNASLRHLSQLPELRTLSLQNTAIGDAAVVHLLSLPPSVSINLHGTQITARGIKQLQEASIRVSL